MRLVEAVMVGLIVVACLLQALRGLLPFKWRVALARRLTGRCPDRLIVWWAGRAACEACGGRGPVSR
jgi:hypothetical protein